VNELETIQVKIHDLARGGSGVAKLDTGEIVFVPFTAPGDEVKIRITQKSKSYSQAELVELVHSSPIRAVPPCKVFTVCGGCAWQHLPYSLQFETKKKGLHQTLKRSGLKFDEISIDEMPAAEQNHYHYRNRIQLRGNPEQKTLGFYVRESTRIVAIDRCEVAVEPINQHLPEIRSAGSKEFAQEYKVEVELASDKTVRHAFNQRHAAFGFRQVNDEQNIALQKWVSDHAGSDALLLDLYGGFGNLSLPLASRFKAIHCVDLSVPEKRPATTPAHFAFHQSSVLGWLKKQNARNSQSATVLLDPPREGLGGEFAQIERLLTKSFAVKTLILIGCDVDSFARDASRFQAAGYQLKKLAALDLFPQTPHLESLALFTK
jgi:23S rRNA (uracil1939-C5)-methyltransferase